ncbi:MAG: tRNA (N6-isopentenyl adenosine(37)-C2)-methylthiotransferase MiaB [Thermosulfidibacteraceae bacterium]|jgi:tRNA-2-methylthio-N6-dimethylallyladenosine synthase
MAKSFYIKTFGCQMNEHDTEKIKGLLEYHGYIEAEDEKEADIIIINTCAVREKPVHKVYSEAGRFKKTGKIIGIAGCVAQKDGEKLLKRLPHVSFVIGPRNTYRIIEAIKLAERGEKIVFTDLDSRCKITDLSFPVKRENPYRAYITVMEGCDNFCSYCIVPFVRGRETSRPINEIIEEARKLADLGYKEIILLGQNVNSYGKDVGSNFVELLQKISEIEGIEWIRFITSHPKDFNDELIEVVATNPKICEYIHLPAQSGSNRILKLMNRKYTKERYLEIIEKLKSYGKYFAFTSDFIVGFPTESEKDFEETVDLIEKVEYEGIFAFIYNPREFTAASKMFKDDVPPQIKKERLKRLLQKQDKITEKLSKAYIGKTVDVLFDTYEDGILIGRTRTFKIVKASGDKSKLGYILKVKIKDAKMYELIGEIVKEVQNDKNEGHKGNFRSYNKQSNCSIAR